MIGGIGKIGGRSGTRRTIGVIVDEINASERDKTIVHTIFQARRAV
jgi:hypothetical protein